MNKSQLVEGSESDGEKISGAERLAPAGPPVLHWGNVVMLHPPIHEMRKKSTA